MGTSFFKPKGPAFQAGNMNLLAKAGSSAAFNGRGAAIGAQRDLAAAKALGAAQHGAPKKTAVTGAPGPKKV